MTTEQRRYVFVVAKALLFVTAVISGLNASGETQITMAYGDYRGLFWAVLQTECIHLILVTGYFLKVKHWTRWILVPISIISLLLLCELATRAW